MEKRRMAIIVEFVEGKVELYEVRNLDFIENLRKAGKLHPLKTFQMVKAAIVSQLKAFKLLPFM